MAKIYETKEDVLREQLTQEKALVHKERLADRYLGWVSMLGAVAATAYAQSNPVKASAKLLEKVLHWMTPALLGASTLFSFGAAFMGHRKERKILDELKKLGEEEMKFSFLKEATFVPAKGQEDLPVPSFVKQVDEKRAEAAAEITQTGRGV